MSISAMKQALEALALVAKSDEWQGCQTYEGQIATSAYEALSQAIAEAEDAVDREREACAMECIKLANKWTRLGAWGENNEFHECADSIRARGEK